MDKTLDDKIRGEWITWEWMNEFDLIPYMPKEDYKEYLWKQYSKGTIWE